MTPSKTHNADGTAGIAHDLKRPVSVITMLADLMIEDMDTPHSQKRDDKLRETLREIVKQGQLCSQMIERMQASNSLQQTNFKDADVYEDVDVNDLIKQTIDQVRFQTDNQGISIRQDLEPNLPAVRGDAQPLQQLITNLVNNAIDAMQDSPRKNMRVSSYKNQEGVNIKIADSGCGIAEQDRDHIFKAFYTTKGEGGTGLGLSICKSIVDAHNGRISVNSKDGHGTSFNIFLPCETKKKLK